jgi:hypothetical protein
MDEQDLWSIELVKLCTPCKAKTSLGQSQKICKLQLGGGLVVLKTGAILDG